MLILAELWETKMIKRGAERTDHLSVGFLYLLCLMLEAYGLWFEMTIDC